MIISFKPATVYLISSSQAYLKEATAIVRLVIFDAPFGASLIYSTILQFENPFVWIRNLFMEVCLKCISLYLVSWWIEGKLIVHDRWIGLNMLLTD